MKEAVFWDVAPCSIIDITLTLKMEASGSSEASQ
jgi:hypothetical protein